MRSTSWSLKFLVGFMLLQLSQAFAAASLAQLQADGARLVTNAQTGVIRFVGFDGQTLSATGADPAIQRLPAQAAAAQHLANYGKLFGLSDPARETSVKKHVDEASGRSVTRYQQNYQGIPVIGGELIVNQTDQKQLSSISGKVSPNLKLDTTAKISQQQAADSAVLAVAKWYSLAAEQIATPKATLSVYDSRLISPFAEPVALVWQMEVRTKTILPIREFIAINANTGTIVLHFNQVPHAKNRLTYDAHSTDPTDPANPAGVIATFVCGEGNSTCNGITDAVFAHRYAGTTYDFYANTLGRNGIDGAGMTMVSVVRICPTGKVCPYANAFWDGSKMSYGEGYAVGEDVVAHELSHGVTEHESGLFYYYQSGAINESLSDVFGELVQQSNALEPVSAPNRWLMGEKLSIGAIRSMSSPTSFGDPDRMTSLNYYTGASDQGGVHTNSGVNNKAAYLMVDGGTFNGRTVTALGLTKTAKIYYRVQTNLLTSGSDYLDLHNALYQACQDLTGTSGITSGDCTSVQNATLAVEMNQVPAAGFMPSANMCPSGQGVASTVFSDGFESGGSNWTVAHSSGAYNWGLITDYSANGLYSVYGYNPSVISDLTLAMASSVTLPANAQLWFNHSFGFETSPSGSTFYDGGVLEYSTNSGGSWTDAIGLYAEGQSYAGLVASGYGNSLAGHYGFVSESHGYVSSRFNLSTLAGQSVRFRWRVASDSEVDALGWVVDDVKIHACAPAPDAPTNVAVTAYPGKIKVSFIAPANTGSGITGYTVSCTAPGQTTRTSTGASSPIYVQNLTANVVYACRVTTQSTTLSSTASAAVTVTSRQKTDLTPILMLLLD
jgi:Zn-dependent metalloprotease